MVWLRFDDQFPIHRKVSGLSDAAFRLHVSAIFWCARNLTDGVVPEEDLDDVSARVRTPQRFVPELVKRGVWEPVENGWQIHDYLDFQWSKIRVEQERRKSADRQKKFRESHSRSSGRSNAVTNAVDNATPVPSSPEGTRTDTGSQSSSRRNARAWADDDDSIDLGIVELLAELTNQQISVLDATRIRQRILGRRHVEHRGAYVAAALADNPGKFLPATEGVEPNPDGPPLKSVPEWCTHCESDEYRWLELADGTWAKCPACNPDAAKEAS